MACDVARLVVRQVLNRTWYNNQTGYVSFGVPGSTMNSFIEGTWYVVVNAVETYSPCYSSFFLLVLGCKLCSPYQLLSTYSCSQLVADHWVSEPTLRVILAWSQFVQPSCYPSISYGFWEACLSRRTSSSRNPWTYFHLLGANSISLYLPHTWVALALISSRWYKIVWHNSNSRWWCSWRSYRCSRHQDWPMYCYPRRCVF